MRKKALIYRRGGLGDTLLVFPILEILKAQGFHVTAVGNTDYFALAREVGWADRVLSEVPANEDFDFKAVIGIGGNVPLFPDGRKWVVEHYLETLGFSDFRFSKTLPVKPSQRLRKAFLHPSSGSALKNAPLEIFLEAQKHLARNGFEVVWLIGEAETHLRGKFDSEFLVEEIPELAKELNKGSLLIGNDSGFAHLSSYLGVPTVVIYGPTDPLVWKPIGTQIYQLTLGLDCSPCFPNVCEVRKCLSPGDILERLVPLLNHILIKVNK